MSPGPENSDSQEIPWDEAIAQLGDFIDEVRDGETVKWLPKELFHRRGNYASVSAGITHGNGRKVRCFDLLFAYLTKGTVVGAGQFEDSSSGCSRSVP